MRVERGLYSHIAWRSVISQLEESPSTVAVISQPSGALTLMVATSGLPSGADATPGGRALQAAAALRIHDLVHVERRVAGANDDDDL
eukprot:6194597-Pleurochrysis_carterae.AAC.1